MSETKGKVYIHYGSPGETAENLIETLEELGIRAEVLEDDSSCYVIQLHSAVAHELRNIRSVLQGCLDLFDSGRDWKEGEYLDIIRSVNTKMKNVIERCDYGQEKAEGQETQNEDTS